MIVDIKFLKEIALEAGRLGLSYFGKVTATLKDDKTLLTEADLKIDKFLTEVIKKKYPAHHILSEEMESIDEYRGEEVVWAIDPIDGTAAFASGLPVWGISIGVFVRNEPKFGVVYLPVTDELYYSDGEKSYLGKNIIEARNFEIDRNSFLAVPSNAHRALDLKSFKGKTRSMGSIAAHLCYVAGGVSIGAVMKPHLWDIAAGLAIMKTSGAGMMYLEGNEIDWKEMYNCKQSPKWCLACRKDKFDILSEFIKII